MNRDLERRPTAVVIGGGYGAVNVAKAVDADLDVVLGDQELISMPAITVDDTLVLPRIARPDPATSRGLGICH